MISNIFDNLLKGISRVLLATMIMLYYVFDDHELINSLLPENGKPLTALVLILVAILYELMIRGDEKIICQLKDVSKQIEVSSVTHSISSLYRQHIVSQEEFITDETTIKEIDDTHDKLIKLGMNSYKQRKIEFLASKIKRT
jgi:hypothetical protein